MFHALDPAGSLRGCRDLFCICEKLHGWTIEVLFKELKSGLGLGEHQVTKEVDRIGKSIGVAIIACLVLIRARKRDIRPGQSWSIFQLKNNLTNDVICNQFQHNLQRKLDKLMKAA
jgi:hypothetical protein